MYIGLAVGVINYVHMHTLALGCRDTRVAMAICTGHL